MGNFANRILCINKWCVVFEKALLCVLLFTIIFLAFGQIVSRNILSMGFLWIDQVLKISVLWISFTGASLASEYNRHIKMDILYNLIHSKTSRMRIEIIAQFSTMIICALLFAASAEYMVMISSDPKESILPGIPDWCFRGIIPYCFLAIEMRCSIHMFKLLNKKGHPYTH